MNQAFTDGTIPTTMSTESRAPAAPRRKFRPTRIFFGLIGVYVSLMAGIALEHSLQGGPVAPEIGSRVVDCGLLLATFVGGVLIVVTAIIAERVPELARKTGIGGGTLLLAQALVTAGFVLAWEPPAGPDMAGLRIGLLFGTGLWVAMGATVALLSAGLRTRSRGSVGLVDNSGMPT